MFDKDGNGVIDLYEFVKAFDVCEEKVIVLIHKLVENQLTYEDLKNR